MTEFSFPNVSVASSGGEYFQVSFADKEDSDDAYFLIQRNSNPLTEDTFTLKAINTRCVGISKSERPSFTETRFD